VVTTFLGNRQREAARSAEEAVAANEDLVSVMRQSGETAGAAAQAWIQATPGYVEASNAARQLGFDLATLNAIVTGQATPAQMDELVTLIRNGSEEAREFGRKVLDLATIYRNSADASGVMTTTLDANTDAQDENAEAIQRNNDELREQIKILEGIARAHLDLADAQVSTRDAQIALEDAQQSYNEALEEAQDTANATVDAELELARAQLGVARAQREVAEAEENVATARVRAAEAVRDAQRDVADANHAYHDSLDAITEAEERLAELRLGPASKEFRDAINDLRNAELRLARAHQTVADAEWYLQHLREEGASNRDIEDAELGLSEAQQEVADSQAELSDSTEKLNDLRDEGEQAHRIADAEMDLQQAVRDSQRALEDLSDSQEELADARQRQANDTVYQEAQEDLIDTQLALRDATLKVRDAENELEEIRAGRANQDAERAAMELETALIRMAQANAEVRRQTALAAGETWDSGDAAHALADELSALLGLAPDPAARQRLQEYIDTLRQAPSVPDAPADGGNTPVEFDPTDYGLPPIEAMQGYLDELDRVINDAGNGGGGKSIWEQIWDAIGGGSGAGGLAGGAIGMAIGGPLGAAIGGIIGSIIGGLVEKFWPQISSFFSTTFERLAANLPQWANNVGRFFGELPFNLVNLMFNLPSMLGNLFTTALRTVLDFLINQGPGIINWFIGLPIAIMGAFGGLTEGLKRIATEFIMGFVQGFTERWEGSIFQDIAQWLYDHIVAPIKRLFGIASPSTVFADIGRAMIDGLVNGALAIWNGAGNFFNNVGQWIRDRFIGAGEWLLNTGRDLVSGMWNGVSDFIRDNPLSNLFEGAVDGVKGFLGIGSPSKLFHQFGSWMMQGMNNGLQSQQNALVDTVSNVAGAMESELARDYLNGFMQDPQAMRAAFAEIVAPLEGSMGGGNTYNETLNLEAITTADPAEVVNEYVWQKRVRLRGGVNA
jgi:hypothetical protein